jgi:hypothetical protein
MTVEELRKLVRKWDFEETGEASAKSEYGFILDQLEYHASKEWSNYSPTDEHSDFSSNYTERLAAWVGNVSQEVEQQLLLKYALHISFFSHRDFIALYRTAMNREISRWVASEIGARLEPAGAQGYHEMIHQEIQRHTWFCPVTDSMNINEFHKVNHLTGIAHHPHFSTLQKDAEHPQNPNPRIASDWIRYMNNPGDDLNRPSPSLERLVLLEDIVGSSTQCIKAIRWAVKCLGKPVLFVPLILCPNGVKALESEVELSNEKLSVRPIIVLNQNDLLGPGRLPEPGWSIGSQMEDLATKCKEEKRVKGNPFGFKTTGCSLSTFSNCPNNTIPLVHRNERGKWNALFPRISRE